jgi:hypothetical protein
MIPHDYDERPERDPCDDPEAWEPIRDSYETSGIAFMSRPEWAERLRTLGALTYTATPDDPDALPF